MCGQLGNGPKGNHRTANHGSSGAGTDNGPQFRYDIGGDQSKDAGAAGGVPKPADGCIWWRCS